MKINKKRVLSQVLLSTVLALSIPILTVNGAVDPTSEHSTDEVTNYINVGLSLVDNTPYVYGGGHSDWLEQRELETPTGLDNSSFVAWTLYRGLGIDLGYAPTAGEYEDFFEVIDTGSLDKAQRGDLIADDESAEIYIGKDSDNKHYSLVASNDRNNIDLIETNWGRNISNKKVLRVNVDEIASGNSDIKYDPSVILDKFGERSIGSDINISIDRGDGTQVSGTGNKTQNKVLDEDEQKESAERYEEYKERQEDNDDDEKEDDNENKEDGNEYTEEDLFAWLDPIVDFSGTSNTHAKSDTREHTIDGNNKGLRGHQRSIFESMFGRFDN